jgi:hypothetical protein
MKILGMPPIKSRLCISVKNDLKQSVRGWFSRSKKQRPHGEAAGPFLLISWPEQCFSTMIDFCAGKTPAWRSDKHPPDPLV